MKRILKKLEIIILGFVLPIVAFSQQSKFGIIGRVIDSASKKPSAYATINLLDAKRASITSAYSLENGNFTLRFSQAGSYIIEVSSVGYVISETSIVVKEEQTMVNAGDIFISAATGSLQEVTVVSRKKIIEQRPGMLVYNAENDLTNKGGTAADVLRKAPVLNVDAQGNVSMRGSSNLKILINGKYSGQMARSPADALNMMPADIIKSVEVITTPSAKYDAEGAAGVINIITKKGRKNVNGTLEASASNMEQMFNPRISSANDKWNFNLAGHLHRLRQKESFTLNREQKENGTTTLLLNQESEKDNAAPHGSADFSIVYTPDSVTEISLGSVSWFGKWPEDSRLQTAVRLPNGSVTEQYSQATDAAMKFLGSDINIAYNRKFKRPGQEITLLAQYSPSSDKSNYYFSQLDGANSLLYQEYNNSKTKNREWTLQADYIQPLSAAGKHSLETGFKIIQRNVGNNYNVLVSGQQPDEMLPAPDRSDYFKYSQDVYAAYAMLKANMKNNWYVEAGARVEETRLEGNFAVTLNKFENRFTNFVPTATVSKKINEEQTIGFSYTKRLTRPYIWDLNPNANASDPKNIISGNPALNPEIAHQAELTYGFNGGADFFLNTALFWRQTDNAIVDFTSTDPDGISFTSKQNLAANKQYGLNFSSFISFSPKWSINGNINVNYLDYSSDALQILRKGWAADVNLNMTFKLPERYTIQAFGEYDSHEVNLQGYETSGYFYSFAVKKELPSKKITITASAINPFSQYIKQTVFAESPSFVSTLQNRRFQRAFKLTINWEFGSMFQQKQRKKVTNDDVKEQGKG